MKQEEIMEEMKKNNDLMSGKGEGGKWITVNGSHIFIEDGQSVDEAMEKHFSKSGDTKTDNLVKKYQSAVDHAIKTYGRVGGGLYEELDNNGLYIDENGDNFTVKSKTAKTVDKENQSVNNEPKSEKQYYKNTSYRYNDEIHWETVKQNEKVNGAKAKNPKRHDKYGNELLSDEAFNVGLEAGQSYLAQFKDLNQFKRSNVSLGYLQTIVSNSIVNNGFDPNLDTTYQDFNEIIGNLLGEEVDLQQYDGHQGPGFTGRKYIGYKPASN